MALVTHGDYRRCLEAWFRASQRYLNTAPDRPDLDFYGSGYNTWGVQTNQKALSAIAVLGLDPETSERRAGASRDEIIDCALRLLRFSLESHIEGSHHCMDGDSWGHTWISVLGVERMMHAVDGLVPHMTDADKDLLRTVLISESDWLTDEYGIVADPDGRSGRNHPESNLWNGAVLHRTAMMYPDAPRADEYREKGSRFLVNSISVPSDATLDAILDGKPVSEWHVGGNFFESYALHHHAYLNVGYMVICLSNLAMLHFSYRERGLEAPESLYHHAYDLWRIIKKCTFPDGRLLRIGGDTRVRYCYCQDYAIPMWLFLLDHYGETDCVELEAGWLKLAQHEQKMNGDGTFLSERLTELEKVSPLYYTRLESDRATTLSMGAYWRRVFDEFTNVEETPEDEQAPVIELGPWTDEFHGACFHRSETRLASWVWEAAERPQGLCLPPERSDLAEWRHNLVGEVRGLGNKNYAKILSHSETAFDGGFVTIGRLEHRSEQHVAEGQGDETLAFGDLLFAALPDDQTVVVMQRATTKYRVYLDSVKGLRLHVPNDMFNEKLRTYYSAAGVRGIRGCVDRETVQELGSAWLNVDDTVGVVGVYGADSLSIYRPGKRQIGLKSDTAPYKARGGGMLYADEICYPCCTEKKAYEADTVLFDVGFLVQANASVPRTRRLAASGEAIVLHGRDDGDVRGILLPKPQGGRFVVLANFGNEQATVNWDVGNFRAACILGTDETLTASDRLCCTCAPGAAKILDLK